MKKTPTFSNFEKFKVDAGRLNQETGVMGLDNVLDAMNQEINGILNRTAKGVISATLFVARVAKLRTPVGRSRPGYVGGNLRASQQILNGKTANGNPYGEVGYGANYALWVHEMPPGTNFKEGQSKFLESALNESRETVIDIIKNDGFVK